MSWHKDERTGWDTRSGCTKVGCERGLAISNGAHGKRICGPGAEQHEDGDSRDRPMHDCKGWEERSAGLHCNRFGGKTKSANFGHRAGGRWPGGQALGLQTGCLNA